jgi:hypothetical protein
VCRSLERLLYEYGPVEDGTSSQSGTPTCPEGPNPQGYKALLQFGQGEIDGEDKGKVKTSSTSNGAKIGAEDWAK